MSIYVVRHGQTDYNKKNIFQGHKDIPLNKDGILQAKEMAKLFEHINIDIMLVSPLTRTRQTAKYINEIVKTEMIIENRLIERNYGKMEGKTNRPDWNNIMMLDYNANYDNEDIEPIQELFKRIFSFLDETIQKFKDKNILLVTHGAVSQAIECYFKGMPKLTNFESLEPLALKTGQCREYSDILIEQKLKELN